MPEAGVAEPARLRSLAYQPLGQGDVPLCARRWAGGRACSPSRACAGSPVPPRRSHVARSNWYLPRYWPSADTAAGLPPDSHCAMRSSVALVESAGALPPPDVADEVYSDAPASRPESPSAAAVFGPTTPSTVRPWRRWKRRTAARVRGPYTPSAGRPSARWIAATDTPPVVARAPPLEGGDVSCASAPPAATALAMMASVTPARLRSARRRRRAAVVRRSREARSDRRHGRGELRSLSIPTEGLLRRLVAYGVSCRARAGRALRRAMPAIRPRDAEAAQWVPLSPSPCAPGTRLGFNSSAAL